MLNNALSMSAIMETEGDKSDIALMAAVRSDLNKISAITWDKSPAEHSRGIS